MIMNLIMKKNVVYKVELQPGLLSTLLRKFSYDIFIKIGCGKLVLKILFVIKNL